MHKSMVTAQNGQDKAELTQLRGELRQMGRWLALMPLSVFDRPAGARSAWPDCHQQKTPTVSQFRAPIRPKLTPQQITLVQDWLVRIMRLEVDKRRIVLARATGIPWRRLEDMDGRSHTTLRKLEEAGLRQLLRAESSAPTAQTKPK